MRDRSPSLAVASSLAKAPFLEARRVIVFLTGPVVAVDIPIVPSLARIDESAVLKTSFHHIDPRMY